MKNMGRVEMLKAIIIANAKKDGTDNQCALRDLITDLMHTADYMKLKFEQAAEGAYEVYMEEGGFCSKCGFRFEVHNDDGSCVED